jgi:16S rRNA (guanine527-N7)-methyltransferase
MHPNDKRSLESAFRLLEIKDSQHMLDQIDRFIQLLREWNQRINLISRKDILRLMGRHILESIGLIGVVSFPPGSRIMDIGTGAGFPGVPLAIVRPDLRMTLVEAKRKKILFLQKTVQRLGLENVRIVSGRIEGMAPNIAGIDFVLSRAVADITTLCQWSLPLFGNHSGILIALKGLAVTEELAGLKKTFPDLHPELIPYHPFPDLTDTRAGQVIRISF